MTTLLITEDQGRAEAFSSGVTYYVELHRGSLVHTDHERPDHLKNEGRGVSLVEVRYFARRFSDSGMTVEEVLDDAPWAVGWHEWQATWVYPIQTALKSILITLAELRTAVEGVPTEKADNLRPVSWCGHEGDR